MQHVLPSQTHALMQGFWKLSLDETEKDKVANSLPSPGLRRELILTCMYGSPQEIETKRSPL